MKKENKETFIKHSIKCDTCGKKATINLCNVWEKYEILDNGDYSKKQDSWDGESGFDLCYKCYEEGDY